MSRNRVEDYKPDPTPSPAALDPTLRLAAAVLLQAITDRHNGAWPDKLQAAVWLLTDGYYFAHGLGFANDPDDWRAWVWSGCPSAAKVAQAAGMSRRFAEVT